MKKLLALIALLLLSTPAHANFGACAFGDCSSTGGGGSGTISSATINQVPYYSASTTIAGDAGLTYDPSTDILTAGSYATAASTDPYSIYDVSTATDYDYWQGVSSDNNNTADTGDYFSIGTGTTPFSNIIFKMFNTGGMTWGDGTSSTHTFKWHTAYTTADPSQILTSTSTSVKSSTTGWVAPASSSSQVLYDMQGTFNGALTSTAIGYGQRAKFTYSGAASNQIYNLTGDIQMTNTSGTQAEAVGVYGTGTRNGAGGTTTAFYGGSFDPATVTAGTLTNNYALRVGGKARYVSDAQTIADNANGGTAATLTLVPATSNVELTCSDAQGCDITLSETGVLDGTIVHIVNVSANTCNFADTSGVTELAGAFAAGQYDSITLRYIVDRWVEAARSNN
jgi:hypothetical protein